MSADYDRLSDNGDCSLHLAFAKANDDNNANDKKTTPFREEVADAALQTSLRKFVGRLSV